MNESQADDHETVDADVVVLGAGASGTAAALAAAERGARVVVLEKADRPGGAGLFGTEGLLAYQSRHQKAAGETATILDGLRRHMEYTHYRANGPLTQAIYQQSPEVIDWLEHYGLELRLTEPAQRLHGDDPRVYHRYVDKVAGYTALYNHLAEMGGWVLTGTRARRLRRGADGAARAVEAVGSDGTGLVVNARAVVVATGGYAGDRDLMSSNLEVPFEDLVNQGYRENTGDGLHLAHDAGAAAHRLGIHLLHAAMVVAPGTGHLATQEASRLINLPILWVNQAGVRFVDENVVYDLALWGNACLAAGGHYWAVLDDATVRRFVAEGTQLEDGFGALQETRGEDEPEGYMPDVPGLGAVVGQPQPGLEASLTEAVGAGVALRADSLDDLGRQLGADPGVLTETVDRYNAAVETGRDDLFGKSATSLVYPVATAPFYAVRGRSATLSTLGGVLVNERLEALDDHRRPIPGLYVVGNDASGIYGDSYPTIEGVALAFAFGSGRIAGHNAAARAVRT